MLNNLANPCKSHNSQKTWEMPEIKKIRKNLENQGKARNLSRKDQVIQKIKKIQEMLKIQSRFLPSLNLQIMPEILTKSLDYARKI